MGRRKKRRLRGRHGSFEAAVETVDFEVDASAAATDRPSPDESVAPEAGETFPGRRTAHAAMPGKPASSAVAVATSASASEAPASAPDPVQEVQTLGELLQQAREARGLTLEATSARTRISTLMLRHLESDRFGEFAADAYVKGFLRNYGGFLGLDIGMLLRRYEAISGRLVERDPEILELETAPRRRRHRSLRRFAWPALAVLVLLALAWIFWSSGAERLGLRPQPGLEQIEEQLRDGRRPVSVPTLVPAEPSILLPESPWNASPADSSVGLSPASWPASERSPLPASPVPRPVTPTQRSRPTEDASPPDPAPPAPQPVEDLAPPARP